MAINEHIESFSSLRQLDVRVYVLDYEYKVLDEISGLIESANIAVDADSDIRRTINISMILNQGFKHTLGSYNYYNNDKQYHQGDIVRFGDTLYECINTRSVEIELIDKDGNSLLNDEGDTLTISSGDGNYIVGIAPFYSLFWTEYTIPVFASSLKYWAAGNPYWFDKYIKVEVGIKNVLYYQYNATKDYDNDTPYRIGDAVKYGGRIYKCKTVSSIPIALAVQGEEMGAIEEVQTSDLKTIQVKSTDARYIQGIIPTNINYWDEIEEYTWVNQGIYMINAPSITYNATDNILSFQAIDLMSKLTGMRDGYLEGMTYQIKAGSSITEAIKSILEEQRFAEMILQTPPINETPIDINIDIGSTAYDLLTQLRDINPNWEMFFDTNGVFRFQQIPSGQNEVSEFGDEVWDKVGLGYNLNTSFEDVKNYIEIVGKQIEPDETANVVIGSPTVNTVNLNATSDDGTDNRVGLGAQEVTEVIDNTDDTSLHLILPRPWSSYYSTTASNNVVWYVAFTLGNAIQQPSLFTTPYTEFTVTDIVGIDSVTITISDDKPPIYYNNEAYFVRLEFSNNAYVSGAFAGYLQPRAIAFENNADSPFYVGYAIEHLCARNSILVDFVDEDYDEYIAEYTLVGTNGVANLDITTGLNYKTFMEADEGTQWEFKIKALINDVPITTINLTYGGGANEPYMVTNGSTFENFDVVDGDIHTDYYVTDSIILSIDNQPIYKDNLEFTTANAISLDFDSEYLLTLQKVNDSLKIIGQYYPIPSEKWETPTTKIHNVPRFTKMVRGVFSGDEYDNIYTNDLARQRSKYELYLNCRLHDTINIDCVPLYWLDVNKLMSYTANSQYEDNKWIIKSISTDLSVNGTQSINAMRYYALYNE